ncbi:hypothetical protein [Pseudodesulfovibrio sp.]|uniref:hypothetical protein n=1 Tax=unclassified Pseudodesulfovibrio TaxID=2661612 RepID=UPI003B009A2C
MKEKKSPLLDWPIKPLRIYWEAYGGWSALFRSGFFWASLCVALVCTAFMTEKFSWHELAISILPDLLGFSLGGYVIMVGFGDVEFLEALRGRTSSSPSSYMKMNAAFVHFLVVQTTTLLLAIMSSSLGLSDIVSTFIGMFLLFYTIGTLFAAIFNVLTVSNWYDQKPK